MFGKSNFFLISWVKLCDRGKMIFGYGFTRDLIFTLNNIKTP